MKKMLKKLVVGTERKLMQTAPALAIRMRYFRLFWKWLDLKNPKTLAEKIQWMKLHHQDPLLVKLADKYQVREHIEKTVGADYLISMPFVWDHAEDVDFSVLPDSFVLKPNNSSGRVLICKDKATLDVEAARKTLQAWEKENLTKITGEWIYEKIPFKIVCEEFLEDKIVDYKMYYGGGQFICTQVIGGRSEGNKTFGYMDENWQLLPIRRKGVPAMKEAPEKPGAYEEMLAIGKKLAEGFVFIRVDLYYVAGKVYFGELSFYPNNGFIAYETAEMDEYFSSKIALPGKEAGR